MKTAKLAIIDLDALSAFAEDGAIENINEMQRQIEEYLRAEMERQGIERSRQGLRLTPQAMKLFQGKVLQEIFSDLQARGRGGTSARSRARAWWSWRRRSSTSSATRLRTWMCRSRL